MDDQLLEWMEEEPMRFKARIAEVEEAMEKRTRFVQFVTMLLLGLVVVLLRFQVRAAPRLDVSDGGPRSLTGAAPFPLCWPYPLGPARWAGGCVRPARRPGPWCARRPGPAIHSLRARALPFDTGGLSEMWAAAPLAGWVARAFVLSRAWCC
ncbi:unnamed protein product [Amoebophrya sp. A120]|nr:unnamed protein product [Amoebophrya sp. A120]|eukprot:GSA120T00024273001.1